MPRQSEVAMWCSRMEEDTEKGAHTHRMSRKGKRSSCCCLNRALLMCDQGAAEKQAKLLLCILFTVTGFGMWAEIFKEEIEK